MQSISEWPVSERPREKLLVHGPGALSDAELLAVLLGSGRAGRCALTIARELLTSFGSLRGIVNAPQTVLCQVAGVGEVRYAQLQAALEVIRRQLAEPLKTRSVFNNPQDIRKYLQAYLKDEHREVFGLLLLDSQHQLLAFRQMFVGTINSAAVYPRELVKQVLLDNAAAVVLVHNHPSGVAEPSQSDVHLTRDVKAAMALIDVAVLDHFIVGDICTISFAQRGLL